MFSQSFYVFLSNIVVRKCVFNENAGVQIYLLIQNFKPLRSIRIIASYDICSKQGWVQDFLSFTQLLKSSIYWTNTQSVKKELNVITQQNNKIHCVFHKNPIKIFVHSICLKQPYLEISDGSNIYYYLAQGTIQHIISSNNEFSYYYCLSFHFSQRHFGLKSKLYGAKNFSRYRALLFSCLLSFIHPYQIPGSIGFPCLALRVLKLVLKIRFDEFRAYVLVTWFSNAFQFFRSYLCFLCALEDITEVLRRG